MDFVREAGLQEGQIELATQCGTWPAHLKRMGGKWQVAGGRAALLALQLSDGHVICLTLLGPGRLLLTTEGAQQFSAVEAEAPQKQPASESELKADISRVSVLKVCGSFVTCASFESRSCSKNRMYGSASDFCSTVCEQ